MRAMARCPRTSFIRRGAARPWAVPPQRRRAARRPARACGLCRLPRPAGRL